MKYTAVIFDLDGTLLDTLDGIVVAGNQVMAAHGMAELSRDEYGKYVGDGLRRFFEQIVPAERQSEELFQTCMAEFRDVYRDSWHIGTRPYDGVEQLLKSLVAREVRMAVLSNKVDEFARECVRRFLGDYPFEMVLGDREGIAPKPDPAGAFEIIRQMGAAPGDFVYLGDTAVDMKTATAAGIVSVGALWGFRSREELVEAGAQHLIESPTQLLDVMLSADSRTAGGA